MFKEILRAFAVSAASAAGLIAGCYWAGKAIEKKEKKEEKRKPNMRIVK